MKKLVILLITLLALTSSAFAFAPVAKISSHSHTEDCCGTVSGIPSADFHELGPQVKSKATHVTCEYGVCTHTELHGLNFNKDKPHHVTTNSRFGVNKGWCDSCGGTHKVDLSYTVKTTSCH